MNIKNVAGLARQLESLGFEKIGYSLLKRICFKPGRFSLSHTIAKGNDGLNFQVHFDKDEEAEIYFLVSYDVILHKGIVFPDIIINGVNPVDLAERMSEIDWKKAFEINESKSWSLDDKASWEKEQKIEAIIDNLSDLDKTQEGNVFAVNLKHKYWADIVFAGLIRNTSSLKTKSEVSQRFYFFEDQPGISIDEAYRYLQNKWMEKSIQIKRKQKQEKETDKNGNESLLPARDLLKKHDSKRKLIKDKTANK